MRGCFFFFLVALTILCAAPVSARESFSISRKIDCESFSAKSYTTQYMTDFGTILRRQRIIIIPKGIGKAVAINLNQHYSSDTRLNGLKALDDEASDWFCLKADTGRHYLWIGFYCGNEDSTSCRYNTERGELYSDTGRSMHLDRLTDAQSKALYKRLKIPPALPDGGVITPAHDIIY